MSRVIWPLICFMIIVGSIFYGMVHSENEALDRRRVLIAQGVHVTVHSQADCDKLAKALKLETYVCWELR